MSANSHAQNKQIQRDRKRSQGMVQKQIWVWPNQWPTIQAYCQKKAREGLKDLEKAK